MAEAALGATDVQRPISDNRRRGCAHRGEARLGPLAWCLDLRGSVGLGVLWDEAEDLEDDTRSGIDGDGERPDLA